MPLMVLACLLWEEALDPESEAAAEESTAACSKPVWASAA